jgi:hypothetical protein
MLEEAVTSSDLAVKPDFGRIAAYHRRPLTARYAAILKSLVEAKQKKEKALA